MTPAKNADLHGNVPDQAPVALLLIDVVNHLEFDGGESLLQHALPAARRLAALKARGRVAGVPAIYVNDNFGRWRSDFGAILERCLEPGVRGRPLAELLRPAPDDYFVLKPKNSGFYSTSLDILLRYLQVETLVLTGFTADNCVLFTAADAFMRDFHVIVPPDCVASVDEADAQSALAHMECVLDVQLRPSRDIDLGTLAGGADGIASAGPRRPAS